MKKNITAQLTSLAHKLLQLKSQDTVRLQQTAKELYEKLTVLRFIEEHYDGQKPTIGKDAAIEILEEQAGLSHHSDEVVVGKVVDPRIELEAFEAAEKVFAHKDLSELFVPADQDTREVMDLPGISTISKMVLEMDDDDLDDIPNANKSVDPTPPQIPVTPPSVPAVSPIESEKPIAEVIQESTPIEPPVAMPPPVPNINAQNKDLDELQQMTKDYQTMPVFERKMNQTQEKSVSLNDRMNKTLSIGMNDRLGFVRNLFGGNSQDLDRVLSQLSTFETLSEAKDFVQNMVKPDYNNWEGKENYEDRFLEILSRKFE